MGETAGKTTKCLYKVVIGVGADAVPAMLRLEEHHEARGEMLAYDVDRWFGFDRAPATVWRCFDLRTPGQGGAAFRDKIAAHCPPFKGDVACGAVQHKLGGLRGDETGKSCLALGEGLCPACSTLPREEAVHAQQEVALLAAFDFLIGNLDRAVFHGRMLYMCRQRQERCEDFQALRAGIAVPRSKRASGSGAGQTRAFINQLLREVKIGNHGNLFPKINNVFCVNEPAGNRLRVQFVDNGRNLLADAARSVRPNKLWASGEAPALGAASPAGMCCDVAASSPFRKQLQRFAKLPVEEQHAALGWTRARKCDRRWKWSSAQEELVNFAVRRAKELEKCMRSCPGRGEQSDWQRPFLARMTADRLGRRVAEGSRRYHGCKHTAFSGACRDGVLLGNGKLHNVRNYQACAALCRKSAGCVAFSHYQFLEGCLVWSGSCSHERLGPILAAAVLDQIVEDDPVTCWISGAATDDTKPARISQIEHCGVLPGGRGAAERGGGGQLLARGRHGGGGRGAKRDEAGGRGRWAMRSEEGDGRRGGDGAHDRASRKPQGFMIRSLLLLPAVSL